jgi:tetrahydromethanopterin S-methyltransferase subunit G
MEIKEAVGAVLKELIVPELDTIKGENKEIKAILTLTNKRLDDINIHLADQSRRIDALREELTQRVDETNKKMEVVRVELTQRIDETNKKMEVVRVELTQRIDETNKRLDRLYEVIVRKDEHIQIEQRVTGLERDVNELKRKTAA